MDFEQPPVTENEQNSPRRVGFELEFTGLSLPETAEVLQETLGGKLEPVSEAEHLLKVEELGDFNIEIDWSFLKKTAADVEKAEGKQEWLSFLAEVASLVVPMELVCPPLTLDQLPELDNAITGLRQAGASGTDDSALAAFGVHINTEIPSLSAACVDAYLKAFCLLQWWLVAAHQVNITRKITPYIDLYPQAYLLAVSEAKNPAMESIIDLYLEHNPTRNRALDMLPMLAEIDAERVKHSIDDPRIKKRPAFHYRLPNCEIEKDDWSLAAPWRRWCLVERLANEPAALKTLCETFIEQQRPLLGVSRKQWEEYMTKWLQDQGWV